MTKTQPTVAITGANGFLGTTLVEYFVRQGWDVIALVRQPKDPKKNIRYVKYDMAQPINVTTLKDVDYLVHAAYIKQGRSHSDAFDLNVTAAQDLVRAAKKQKVKKLLFVSSMSAHDEAISVYGKQKLAIEKIFSGPNCVCIRSGLIIGNGGLVKQMVEFMRSKHIVPLVDGGKQPLQIISIDDLTLVINKLLLSNISGLLTVATPEVYTYKELYKAISKQLNIRILFIPLPFFMLMAVIRIINLLPLPLAISPDNALGLKQLKAVRTEADIQRIGIKLKGLEAALKAI